MALKNYMSQLIVVICSCLLAIASSLNFSFPAVFNFGDSNSDTGGLAAGVAFPVGPPNGQTYFHEPSGRFCDGRVVIDFLMDAMDHPFLNPYLDSVGAPSFQTGCNFATGWATILPANAGARNPFSFNIQVAQFPRFKARVLQLLAEDKKLEKYLPSEDYFKQGLYMLDVGQNDLDGAFNSKTEDQVMAFIPTILSQFEAGIQRLYNEGARNFWIHITGPLGCIARIIATFGTDSSKLDQLGCVRSHNNAANNFNLRLHDLCTNFQDQFPDVKVTYVDIFSVKLDLIANYSQYGFKEPLAACCGYGGPPLNFDNRVACGETKNLSGSTVSATPCNNTAEYVNWDGNHYTEALFGIEEMWSFLRQSRVSINSRSWTEQHFLKHNDAGSWIQDSALMLSMSKEVPWYLDDGTGRVFVVGARGATGFALTVGSEVFEESGRSLVRGTLDYLQGLKMLGVKRIGRLLPTGTSLTVVGEAVKDDIGTVRIQRPHKGPFYVSPKTIDELLENLGKWARWYKYASFGLTIFGAFLIAERVIRCILQRKRRWELRRRVLAAAAVQRSEQDNEGTNGQAENGSDSTQRDRVMPDLCVICLEQEYNAVWSSVLLPYMLFALDKLSSLSETDRSGGEDFPALRICMLLIYL
ncbi:hypothetical protein CUMW_054400 [Citrus unshiu]|nr:hypothetical protein CUMW_054400 [Citrus unshiu]